MSQPKRGVLYLTWGTKIEQHLQRSIASLKAVHPELPIKVERILHPQGLAAKASMGSLTPFESTLYLDADTVVLGNLDYAFEKAEQFGLACCICEAPWMRRYGAEHGDRIEYNTGVLFFSQAAAGVFNEWSRTAPDFASKSSWTMFDGDVPRGLEYDDQASFSNAVEVSGMNPFILPLNYNVRPFFHRQLFAPLRIWHSYDDVPAQVREISAACDRNERSITFIDLKALSEEPTSISRAQVEAMSRRDSKPIGAKGPSGGIGPTGCLLIRRVIDQPLVSIITPTNDATWLAEAHESLQKQTYSNFEWVLLANGAESKDHLRDMFNYDGRVKYYSPYDFGLDNSESKIGALKWAACRAASGDVLIEMDHDDLLFPNAIEKVVAAFESNPDVGMVYSNRAAVKVNPEDDDDWTPYYFGEGYGWEYRPVTGFGRDLIETLMPGVHPANFSRIWYAPDHLRAWRASIYWQLQGHDQSLELADDHELSCRFYLGSQVLHLNECLYAYRLHEQNNWLKSVDKITEAMWRNYDRYVLKMYERWCAQQGLATLTFDNASDALTSHTESSIGLLKPASLASCYKADVIATMNEAYRVLAHGGLFAIDVPSTDSRAGVQDPTHRSQWNENSFFYWTRAEFQKYIAPAGAAARFQVLRLRTYFPSDWHQAHNMAYVQAHLIAVKDGPRLHGELLI